MFNLTLSGNLRRAHQARLRAFGSGMVSYDGQKHAQSLIIFIAPVGVINILCLMQRNNLYK